MSETREGLQAAINRMVAAHGDRVRFTSAHRARENGTWIAYGVLVV